MTYFALGNLHSIELQRGDSIWILIEPQKNCTSSSRCGIILLNNKVIYSILKTLIWGKRNLSVKKANIDEGLKKECIFANMQKQPAGVFCEKGILRNFAKNMKTPVFRDSFLIKLQSLPATSLKRSFWHRCFPVNFAKFLRTAYSQNTSGRLLLNIFCLRLVIVARIVFVTCFFTTLPVIKFHWLCTNGFYIECICYSLNLLQIWYQSSNYWKCQIKSFFFVVSYST